MLSKNRVVCFLLNVLLTIFFLILYVVILNLKQLSFLEQILYIMLFIKKNNQYQFLYCFLQYKQEVAYLFLPIFLTVIDSTRVIIMSTIYLHDFPIKYKCLFQGLDFCSNSELLYFAYQKPFYLCFRFQFRYQREFRFNSVFRYIFKSST